jgi:beta-lactamase class A
MRTRWRYRFPAFLAFAMAISILLAPARLPSATPDDSPARKSVEELILSSGGTVSLAFHSIDNEQELYLHEEERYDDGNALRIPIMIELYAEAAAGELRLTDPLAVHDGVRITPDATPYHMDRRADPVVTRATGKTRTLGELCEDMITHSSDFATNLLLERLTLSRVLQRIETLGAEGMEIGAAFPNRELNHTTTRAVFMLLWDLATEQTVNSDACKQMIGLLARSSLHASPTPPPPPLPTPARPPRPTTPGSGALNDAVIIYGAHSFVLVVQVRGLKDAEASAELISKISKLLNDSI